MLNDRTVGAMGLALALTLWPGLAAAQEAAGGDQLMAMDKGALRSEIARRYDAGLALTRDAAVSAADNPRYLWASQAKAQCGIALGFLKSDAKDPVSIGKCDDAYNRMQLLPAPPQAEVQPTAAACNRVPFIVFFDWNKADLTTDAITALDATGSMLRFSAGRARWLYRPFGQRRLQPGPVDPPRRCGARLPGHPRGA
jgi:OmpA-OmpF porin, OOP family